MNKKKNMTLRLLFFSFLFFILYFFLFPYGTEKETVIRPYYIHRLDEETISNTHGKGDFYSFRLGEIFGYLDANGAITYKSSVLYNAALSDRGFINYSSIQDENQTLILSDTSGNFKQNFGIPGYPFFSDNGSRLFIIKTDATGISEIDMENEKSWRADFASIITGFASNDDYAVVGLLNGQLKVYNTSGDCIYTYNPETAGTPDAGIPAAGSSADGSSEAGPSAGIPVVFGCAFSLHADTFASVSGIKPQQLLIFRKGNKNYGNPVRKNLSSEIRRAIYIGYSAADKFLVSEGAGGFQIMDMKTLKLSSLPIPGRIISADMHSGNQLLTVSSYNNADNKSDMYLIRLKNEIILRNRSSVKIEFLRFAGDSLVVGFKNILVVCSISET